MAEREQGGRSAESSGATDAVSNVFRYALLAIGALFIALFVWNAVHERMVGVAAPDLKFPVVANAVTQPGGVSKEVALADYKGKVVLMDFWATWCGPCRQQAPIVESIYEEYKDKGVVVLGVNTDDALLARSWVVATGSRYPMLFDEGGVGSAAFHVESLPTLVIVGKDQKIASVKVGVTDATRLRAILDAVL